MKICSIDPKHRQLLLVLSSVLFGIFLKYFSLSFINIYFSSDVHPRVHVGYLITISFAINFLAFEMFNNLYLVALYFIQLRLSNVVDYLETFTSNEPKYSSKLLIEKLKTCGDLVDQICDALKFSVFSNSLNTISNLLHFSFMTILSIYSIISLFSRKSLSKHDATYTVLTVAWNLFYSPFFIWVFVVSNKIKNKKNEIEICIQKVLEQNPHDAKLFKKAEVIFLQFEHRQPLNSCGFFVINWFLLFQLIAIFSSFLIIIVQFEWKTFDD